MTPMRGSLTAAAALLFLTVVPGCRRGQRVETKGPAAIFSDQRAATGVDFRTAHDKVGLTILETLGHGAGLCDFDGDGNLDLVLTGANRVGIYRGDGKFGFVDVTPASGLEQKGHWEGIATGDVDGDGKVDLYLCGYDCSALYLNAGDLRFRDGTAISGVGVRPPRRKDAPEWRTSAAFVDVDQDGWLDLYVLRYADFGHHTPQLCRNGNVQIACDPQTYDSQRGVFYRNVGDGRFVEETNARGLAKASGHALGLACADYDDDGWVDIAVANDERPGDLFHNRGRGRFEQRGPESGTSYDVYGHVHAGMGIDWGDYDRDGRQDLFITTFQNEEKNLYRNTGNGMFMDMSLRVGISRPIQPWVSWGARFLDYDNDGWLDLLVASGHVQDQAKLIHPNTDYPQPLLLFRNEAGQSFADVSARAGPAFLTPIVGRGVCTGDIDNDGGVDAVVTHAEGQPLLLRNVAGRGRWTSIRLLGAAPNTQGIGARITVETTAGQRVQDVSTSGSFLSANDARAHFGLVNNEEVRGITVRWRAGLTERFGPQPANQPVTLRQGDGLRGAPGGS